MLASYPLAIYAGSAQSDISYSGYEDNKSGTVTIDNVSYDLYHGPVYFTANADLGSNKLTFYTTNNYDLNTKDSIVYDASSQYAIDRTTKTYVQNEDVYKVILYDDVSSILVPRFVNEHIIEEIKPSLSIPIWWFIRETHIY